MTLLNFERSGTGDPLVVLHGLFGAAQNFRGIAKKMAEDFDIIAVDLRNHGASFHHDEHSYPIMAQDVFDLMDHLSLDQAHIMGHSMGGKVAMQMALHTPERIDGLVIGDISPVQYPDHHDAVFKGFNAVDLTTISSRGEAENALTQHVEDPGVRMFLLTNLMRDEDRAFKWRLNIKSLEDNYTEIAKPPTSKGDYKAPTLFMRGGLSDYISEHHIPALKDLFPAAHIHTIDGTGHWLHAEKPDEYCQVVTDFLKGK